MSRPADPNAKDALVAAARAEFVRKGLMGARIEDITAACGLSKGAFYLHFASKEALFEEQVQALAAAMETLHSDRVRCLTQARTERAPLTSADVVERSAPYVKYLALETEFDLQALEMMWEHRDTMDVLIRGCAGTAFEGLVWSFVEQEVARVAHDFETMQKTGAGRLDVEPELFAEVAVGAYFLVGKRLSRLKQRPNLLAWAAALQRLIHEGCLAPPTLARTEPTGAAKKLRRRGGAPVRPTRRSAR